MIVPPDPPFNSGPPKSAEAVEKIVPDVAPPTYDSASSSIVPQHIRPANHISLKSHFGEVKDTFVLDPTLRIPHSMQPRNKKLHFKLKTRMGEAHAVVYIVPSLAQPQGKTRIEVSSRMGTAYLELHAPEVRAPLSIKMSSRLGEATLLLPRSFRGPLRMSTKLGEATLSAGLRASSTIFGNGRVFVGEWRKDEEEKRGWDGDEAFVDSKLGTVHIQYNDEAKA
ncbi:hypothetical protein C8F04DRAFT_1074736 [Mycena alexandri]|uniref:DUF7330 domain-containing protein n=1 Tax=Mycena alexandri TaxID=1745969 RepID=A0AAD6TCX6_9AGAR|nr:hypothetical protein C8F04DRAFT_1074736 [Mycena alexandri]